MADGDLAPEVAAAVTRLQAGLDRMAQEMGESQDLVHECMRLLTVFLAEARTLPDDQLPALVRAADLVDRQLEDRLAADRLGLNEVDRG